MQLRSASVIRFCLPRAGLTSAVVTVTLFACEKHESWCRQSVGYFPTEIRLHSGFAKHRFRFLSWVDQACQELASQGTLFRLPGQGFFPVTNESLSLPIPMVDSIFNGAPRLDSAILGAQFRTLLKLGLIPRSELVSLKKKTHVEHLSPIQQKTIRVIQFDPMFLLCFSSPVSSKA